MLNVTYKRPKIDLMSVSVAELEELRARPLPSDVEVIEIDYQIARLQLLTDLDTAGAKLEEAIEHGCVLEGRLTSLQQQYDGLSAELSAQAQALVDKLTADYDEVINSLTREKNDLASLRPIELSIKLKAQEEELKKLRALNPEKMKEQIKRLQKKAKEKDALNNDLQNRLKRERELNKKIASDKNKMAKKFDVLVNAVSCPDEGSVEVAGWELAFSLYNIEGKSFPVVRCLYSSSGVSVAGAETTAGKWIWFDNMGAEEKAPVHVIPDNVNEAALNMWRARVSGLDVDDTATLMIDDREATSNGLAAGESQKLTDDEKGKLLSDVRAQSLAT